MNFLVNLFYMQSETEKAILKAAQKVFYKKGLAAARMQEIADEAKINKAMLHYYFRSKQQLFEAVFLQAFSELAPLLNTIFNSEQSVFHKIESFVAGYISYVMEHPYLPTFIIQELNINPQFGATFFSERVIPNPAAFEAQINREVEQGILKPIDPKQLVLDLISLTAFPFVGQELMRGILKLEPGAFAAQMESRKKLIPELLIGSIKAS